MIKKALITLTLVLLAAGNAYSFGDYSDYRVPTDRAGVKARNLASCGVYTATIINSSQTFLLVSGTSIAVYGVLTGTDVAPTDGVDSWVELRATDTANVTTELLVPPIAITSTSRNTFIVYDPPVIAQKGLSVNIATTPASVTVFFRYLSTNVAQDFAIPWDKDGGKVYNPAFYGVVPASNSTAGGVALGVGIDSLDYSAAELPVLTYSSATITINTPGLLYGMIVGSAPITAFANYVVLKDTTSVAGAGGDNNLMVPIFYNTFNLSDALGLVYGNGIGNPTSKYIKFPWPIVFNYGLTQKRSASTEMFRILVKPLQRLR